MKSYLLLLLCASLYGSNFVLGTLLLREFPALHLSAFRLTVTTLFFVIYALATRRMTRITWRDASYLIPLAIIGMLIHQVTFFTGLLTTDATTSALILSLAPIFTALLARIFLKEPFTLRTVVGSLIALAGVFFVVGKGGLSLHITIGIWLMFACMLAFSVFIILMRKLTESMDSFSATAYSTLLGSLLLFPVALWREPNAEIHPHWWGWPLLIGSALLIQGICALIWNNQVRKVGAAKASIFLNLQPFVAMIVGYITLGTPITLTQIGGSMLIITGVLLSSLQGLSFSGKLARHRSQMCTLHAHNLK